MQDWFAKRTFVELRAIGFVWQTRRRVPPSSFWERAFCWNTIIIYVPILVLVAEVLVFEVLVAEVLLIEVLVVEVLVIGVLVAEVLITEVLVCSNDNARCQEGEGEYVYAYTE